MNDINKIRKSSAKERDEGIANGTWMPRGAVFSDKKKKERDNPKHKKKIFPE